MREWLGAYLELMGVITLSACTAALAWGTAQEDEWRGFVYPDWSTVTIYRHVGAYTSLERCRSAAQAVIRTLPEPSRADYECGLDCRGQGDDAPMICRRTER